MTEEEKAAFKAAERKAERERLQALDKLTYTPECKALVEKAKEDGRTAADIGLEIAKLVHEDRELLATKAGIRQGAKAGTEIRNVDPNSEGSGSTDSSPEALSKRLVGVFAKRHPEMRKNQNQHLN